MKRNFFMTALIIVTVIFFTSCTEKTETKSFDKAKATTEIQALEDQYAAAEKAKDAKGVAAYYADDAISYGRNSAPVSGKAAITEDIDKRLAKDTTGNHSVYKVVDLFGDDDKLVEVGSWTLLSPSGAEVDKGHYISYFEKRDGKFVCVRDMSASSNPAKPPM